MSKNKQRKWRSTTIHWSGNKGRLILFLCCDSTASHTDNKQLYIFSKLWQGWWLVIMSLIYTILNH